MTQLPVSSRGAVLHGRWLLNLIGAMLLAWSFGTVAQPVQAPARPASAAPMMHAKVTAGPAWAELTPQQKKILTPLAPHWSKVSATQKQKWLEISRTYDKLSPPEQAAMNSRMNEWALLSPQERAQARLNFGKTKELSRQLTPEEKNAKWQAYQALSQEEKSRLAAKASPKPKGAAMAIRPVAPQKLVKIPNQPDSKALALPRPKIAPAPAMAPSAVVPPAAVMPATGASAQPPLR